MRRSSEPLWWGVAVILGLLTGYAHVIVPDPTAVALLALISAMFLGLMQPAKPWVWAVILSLSMPVADTVMYLKGMKFYRGRIEGAIIAGLVSGIVGGYAGSLGRRNFAKLLGKADTPPESVTVGARSAGHNETDRIA